MHKFIRIIETVKIIFKKPVRGFERRIPMSSFFKNAFSDDDNNTQQLRVRCQAFHRFYRQQASQQIQSAQHHGYFDQNSHFGLSDILNPVKRQMKENLLFYCGDYQRHSKRANFVHALQLSRPGAEDYFFSLDEIETTQSTYSDPDEIVWDVSSLIVR